MGEKAFTEIFQDLLVIDLLLVITDHSRFLAP